jgi:predicted AlkP superfamily pyrophosphatase or phosphodiesterase
MPLNKKLLVLILDAFSDKYLKHAPYLSKLCREYYCTTIEPIFAYEGIRVAILTGLNVRESGVWHDKVFAPSGRRDLKIKVLKPLTSFIDVVSPTDYVNKAFRFLLFKILREEYGTPHLIHSKYLEYFATYRHENKGIPDLFQILGKHGVRSAWIEPKLNSMERKVLRNTVNLFRKNDLIVLKLNSLDRLGHKYGPLSTEVRERVKYVDSIVEEAIRMLQNKINNFSFIIMSDHGMAPVEKTLNIKEILEKETQIKPLRDYIPYIGSTFASFYILKKKAEGIINEILQSIGDYGRILSEEEEDLLGINRELYGHIIFVLNERIVFHPNFFQKREIPRGMHGYAFPKYDNAIFIASYKQHTEMPGYPLRYSDVFKHVLNNFAINV